MWRLSRPLNTNEVWKVCRAPEVSSRQALAPGAPFEMPALSPRAPWSTRWTALCPGPDAFLSVSLCCAAAARLQGEASPRPLHPPRVSDPVLRAGKPEAKCGCKVPCGGPAWALGSQLCSELLADFAHTKAHGSVSRQVLAVIPSISGSNKQRSPELLVTASSPLLSCSKRSVSGQQVPPPCPLLKCFFPPDSWDLEGHPGSCSWIILNPCY